MIDVTNARNYGINPNDFEIVAEPRHLENWVPVYLTSNHRGLYALVAGGRILGVADSLDTIERFWHALTPDGREKLSYERSNTHLWNR